MRLRPSLDKVKFGHLINVPDNHPGNELDLECFRGAPGQVVRGVGKTPQRDVMVTRFAAQEGHSFGECVPGRRPKSAANHGLEAKSRPEATQFDPGHTERHSARPQVAPARRRPWSSPGRVTPDTPRPDRVDGGTRRGDGRSTAGRHAFAVPLRRLTAPCRALPSVVLGLGMSIANSLPWSPATRPGPNTVYSLRHAGLVHRATVGNH